MIRILLVFLLIVSIISGTIVPVNPTSDLNALLLNAEDDDTFELTDGLYLVASISITGTVNAVLDCGGKRGVYTSASLTVMGLTFQNCEIGILSNGSSLYADGTKFISNTIGVYSSVTETLLLESCDFFNNSNALFIYGGTTLNLFGNSFRNNYSPSNKGAAISMESPAGTLYSSSNVFEFNSARNGGAIYLYSGTLNLRGDIFANNTALYGGAIYSTGTIIAQGLDVRGNIAGNGGGIMMVGAGSGQFTNCNFTSNSANGTESENGGGALNFQNAALGIFGCYFSFNYGYYYGAVKAIYTNNVTIAGSFFHNNTANLFGNVAVVQSTVYISSSSFESNGGIIGGLYFDFHSVLYLYSSNFSYNTGVALSMSSMTYYVIDGCIFSDNTGGYGTAIQTSVSYPSTAEMIISNCVFARNKANQEGGALFIDRQTTNITNCTFSENSANTFGLAIYVTNGQANIQDVSFVDHPSGNGAVVAISRQSTAYLHKISFSRNYAVSFYVDYYSSATLDECNFFLNSNTPLSSQSGNLTITNSRIYNNTAYYGAGFFESGTIIADNITCEYNAGDRGGCFCSWSSAADVTIRNSVIQYNRADLYGGAFYVPGKLKISNTMMRGNSAGFGGAIDVRGTVAIERSTITGNTAQYGGGIRVFSDAILTVKDSTISKNIGEFNGGGIHFDRNRLSYLNNCTIINNTAINGGGIAVSNGIVEIDFSTITNNTATQIGGGIYVDSDSTSTNRTVVYNSTITNNFARTYTSVFASGTNSSESFVMKDTFFQTKGSQMNFCCQSGQKSNVNGETCSFPVCASGCKEGTGCNCPFVFDFAQIPLVTLNTTCTCTTSYIGNTCSYFDCDTAECSTDASCSREFGCKCYTGYDGDGYTCEDIDECKSGYECPGNNTVCVNTMGDYDCKCASGFERVLGECVDINECKGANDCSPNATCSNYDHGYSCRCNNGFVGNGTYCISTDACGLGHNCSINANCNNDGAGSFFCSCKSGFEGDGYNCSDFNECARNSSICEFGCNNTNGSYECYCDIGFAVNGSRCTDVNECNQAGICGPNAECHNSMGNYSCTCNEGFGGENCSDINECGNGGNNNCSVNAECSNTPGSFNCSCKSGYTGNGYTCEDIDECGPVKTHNCSISADCKNSNGSFTCSCHSGYEGDGYYCNDINECERNLHNCTNSVCNNTEGSFSCLCASGFVWDGSNCTKSESCEQGHNCTTNAECHNTQSSFVCLCPEGFTGDGYSQCEDIDECQMNNGGCDYRVNCTNTNGNRTCSSCPEGYYNSSFSTCSALCGNGICDSTEDCVTCPQDCKDTYCGKCGDGKCDSDVGETCSSCYEDCKSTCEVPTCSSCVHGTCLNGFCTCAESWTGPNCDSAGASIVVTIDDRRPILEIKPNPTNPNLQKFQESITFGISIKRLIEKNSRGEEIKRIELDNDFILVQSFLNSSSNTVWDYYTLLDNKAAINVTFIEFNEDTTYGVFGQPTQFSANTLKVNFRIINWPYSSISNTLDVVMENFVDSGNNNNCVTTENSEDDIAGNLQWLKVSLSGVSMYAKFIARSMIDGRQRDTKFNRTTGSTVTATLPHFWDYAEFDPHYSLLLDSPAEDVQVDECGITTQNEKKDKTGKIAGIAVGTVGGAAVLTASAVYFQSKRRRAQFRKRLTGRINAASSASADSSIPLEANKPAHSSLYRSNESVNPLYHEQ